MVSFLKKRSDFQRATSQGKRYVTPFFIVYRLQENGGLWRVGLTVSRKCGNAVKRNRIKRRLRALVRNHTPQRLVGDWVIIARASSYKAHFPQLIEAFEKILQKTL